VSTLYSRVATVTIGADEQDLPVRGWVDLEGGRAFFDGEPQVRLAEGWFDVSDLDLAAGDRDRIEEGLSEVAFDDDRDACVERDEVDS